MLHVVALAHYAVGYTRGWAIDGRIARARLKVRNDQLQQEVALLMEEIRIKDARMKRGRFSETASLLANRANGDSRTPRRTGMVCATNS